MFRSLYSKLAAVTLVLFTCLGCVVIVYFFLAADMYSREVTQKLNRNLAANIVREHLPIEDQQIRYEALERIFHTMMVINPSIEIYLLDPGGKILEYSAAPGKIKREYVALGPVRTWLSGEASIPLLGDDPRDPGRRKVFSAAPIPLQGEPEGYLYIILGGEEYDSIAQRIKNSLILTFSGWTLLGVLLLAAAAGLFVFALLTRRLKNLARGMKTFTNGKSASALELPLAGGQDEIDQLSLTFRDMAFRIEEKIEELQHSDRLRRELVAGVSHDLRTPLATLTAYIDTIQLKQTELSPEELHSYLQTARRHCSRLNSLVNSLFELAALEARETKLQMEPFNLAELVQDVLQNHELSARDKRIALESNIGWQLPMVEGDIALIERVLENLVINAIRHTPEEGRVNIILTPSRESVQVRIADTGAGIPEDVLPHIFDRFYHTKNQKDSFSSSSTGLGLAIAKRIMTLHGSDIKVESRTGAGTSFTFHLPIHDGS